MAPAAPVVAASYLGLSTLLSFVQGFTTTAAIGGADMRTSLSVSGTKTGRADAGHSSCRHLCTQFIFWIRACCRRSSPFIYVPTSFSEQQHRFHAG